MNYNITPYCNCAECWGLEHVDLLGRYPNNLYRMYKNIGVSIARKIRKEKK